MALYTVDDPLSVAACLAQLGDSDAVLLIGNAVAFDIGQTEPDLPSSVALFALEADLIERKSAPGPNVQVASYDDWVTLSEIHQHHVHWR